LHKYYKRAQKLASEMEFREMRESDNKIAPNIAGADKFLHNFLTMYRKHKDSFKHSLLRGLLECSMVSVLVMFYVISLSSRSHILTRTCIAFLLRKAKMAGLNNPPVKAKVAKFINAIDAISQRSVDFVSANFNCLSKCQIFRIKARDREASFIEHDNKILAHRLETMLGCCPTIVPAVFAVSFDGTKVPELKQLLLGSKKIVGGCYWNHMLDHPDQYWN
jgi:hypothetical protein